ncbi:COP9 signalosome subunit 6 [Rhodotorula diobovata]|uniref:COP9 signalosome complex subunit 6 n=1 Tax=Rhodotorula diobovata TaxID=5288 RepID=A0A5C5FSN0_9BASI|nr:COP9 signalosome subunit 6 [Rhodotorula diobovata]
MATTEGLTVALHPLAILQQSDHWTRVSLQSGSPSTRVVGALLGTQQGRQVEIFNSFELVVNKADNGTPELDHAYFDTRREQFKQVFPTLDFLGWYSVGQAPTPEDTALHKQFFPYNESPLFLQLSPSSASHPSTSKDLPVAVYESVIELVAGGQPQPVFVPAQYEIVTGEAERVAVEGVSKPEEGTEGGAGGSLIVALSTQRNALKMLADRVAVVVRYLEAVTAGTARPDPETLRGVVALLGSLQAGTGAGAGAGGGAGAGAGEAVGAEGDGEGKEARRGKGEGEAPSREGLAAEFMTEYNDVLLTTYLSALTKQLQTANELLDRQLFVVQSSTGAGKDGGAGGRDGSGGGGGGGGRAPGGRRGKHVEMFA